VAGVPLKFKGEIIGTLTVMDDRVDKEFKEEDVKLLELLAPQAAISIRNAGLYKELQERIEAQQLAENRLIRSARLAVVGEMAAGIAHELNNPLTTVTGFTELILSEMPNNSPFRSDLDLVLKEAYRARGVVRRLLDFSRPVEDQRISADVNELIEQVLPLVSHLARTGGIVIKTELQESLPWISLDPNQIKQVLLNIINNAFHAMPKGGTLSIKTMIRMHEPNFQTSDVQQSLNNKFDYKLGSLPVDSSVNNSGKKITEWIAIIITDTGEGIPPENIERIFEPFFSTRPSGKGTGLGLSVSYGIISSHNGFIDVDSQPNKGSSFKIYLPLKRNNPEEFTFLE
jgi:signal transduction histidine kinase